MNILGYPLDRAAAILERAGYRVETVEARSRKGVEGDSKRVVRCLPLPGRSIPTVQLVFCEFKTNVDSLCAEDAADAESTHWEYAAAAGSRLAAVLLSYFLMLPGYDVRSGLFYVL